MATIDLQSTMAPCCTWKMPIPNNIPSIIMPRTAISLCDGVGDCTEGCWTVVRNRCGHQNATPSVTRPPRKRKNWGRF
jgi:hypothetical protein